MPTDLAEVVGGITAFLLPILAFLTGGEPIPRTWNPAGPWRM